MAENKLTFLRGTQAAFDAKTASQLDDNTFYRTNSGNVYLGDIHLNKNNTVFGTCSTAQSTAEKTMSLDVTCDKHWKLNAGNFVIVKFTNAVNSSATLNVNGTGAKSIVYRGLAISHSVIKAGDTVLFFYDGSRYNVVVIDRWHYDITDLQNSMSNILDSFEAKMDMEEPRGFGSFVMNPDAQYIDDDSDFNVVFGAENIINESGLSTINGAYNVALENLLANLSGMGNAAQQSIGVSIEGNQNGYIGYDNSPENVLEGDFTHLEGTLNTGSVSCASHIEGAQNSMTEGYASHAEGGVNVIQSSVGSHAEGIMNTITGEPGSIAGGANHAEGVLNVVTGFGAHAEGSSLYLEECIIDLTHDTDNTFSYSSILTPRPGQYISIEFITSASHPGVPAISYDHKVRTVTLIQSVDTTHEKLSLLPLDSYWDYISKSEISEATCYIVNNIATGLGSHVEGASSVSAGNASHAEGNRTQALGHYSHSEGEGTIAASRGQHVEGSYNIADDRGAYLHIIGNGINDTQRSNAYTLDTSGNAWFAGDVYVKSGIGTYQDDESVKLVKETDLTINNIDGLQNALETIDSNFEELTKNYYGTCGTLGNRTDKIASISGYTLKTGNIITIKFTAYVPANATLNITSTGAKPIYYRGTSITAYTIEDGDIATFIYDGNYYQLISIDKGLGRQGQGAHSAIFNDYKNSRASGQYAHSEGESTSASGRAAHAEGEYTVAKGYSSHAEGAFTYANGDYSHTEGHNTKADGECAHVEGYETLAAGQYQHAQGKYNLKDEVNTYAHIVGNGTRDTLRSNAHTLDWDGNAWFQGDVYVGGTDQNTGSVKLATENFKPSYYGICSTAKDTADKEVTISGDFQLVEGAMVVVKFVESNSVSNPTLNVNGTGAKPLYRYGTTTMSSTASTTGWNAGAIQLFVYDGTGWIRDYWVNSTYSNVSLGQGYATCSTAAATVAKTASLSSYTLSTGGIVSIRFTNSVPANATLNINSKGAKPIYYNNTAITDNVIQAGDTATFIYNGTQYHLLSNDRWGKDLSNLPLHGDEFSITNNIIHLKEGNGIVVDSSGVHHKDTSSQANIAAADGKYVSGLIFDEYGHVTGATAYTNGLTTNGGSLVDGKTLTFSQYGNRFITISGNSIAADMSKTSGGWAGAFASVKHNDPDSTADDGTTTTTLLGWYGGATDLTHIFMGGTYNDPAMKMTKNGYFTFKYRPKVGTVEVALKSDIPTTLKNPNSLIFTGASTETYDGSSEVSVNLIGWKGTGAGAEIFNNSTNIASGIYAHAEGTETKARGDYSHTEGYGTKTQTLTFAAHAEGYNTEALGSYAHAEGYGAIATGNEAHAEGYATQSLGPAAHTEGVTTYAIGRGSHAEGAGVIPDLLLPSFSTMTIVSSKTNSTAITVSNVPSDLRVGSVLQYNGLYAIVTAIDSDTKISVQFSSSMTSPNPLGNLTNATVSVLNGTTSYGESSHAEGKETSAIGFASHAEGIRTIASGRGSHVEGMYNIKPAVSLLDNKGTYVHVVGNGTAENARSNAHTLDWAGNAWFAGDVYVGSTSGTNKDTGSKKLATEDYVVSQFALNDAMLYKGVLDGANPTTYTPAANAGHTYKVATAGLINGVTVQVGDMLICTTDNTEAATAENVATIATSWNVIQTSNGTVTGPTSAVNGRIAVFDGTTGQLIKDSGKTVSSFLSSSITTLTLDSLTLNDNLLIGTKTSTATGDRVLAIGQSLTMSGNNIIVHGSGSSATGTDSMASGYEAKATGTAAHAFGSTVTASDSNAFAAGWDATASKASSFALGEHVTASSQRQFVIGTYNVDDASSVYAFMIGNGTSSSAKSNAFAVKWTGDALFAGNVYSGSITDTNRLVKKSEIGAAAAKGVTDSSSASAISTGSNLVTERDIYYGLPTINNSHAYTSSTTIYAPTAGGTAGYTLVAAGATSTPTWNDTLTVDTTTGVAIKTGITLDNAVKFQYNNNDKCVDIIFI